MARVTVGVARLRSPTIKWPWVPSIYLNLQPFTGNGDVSISVKNSRVGRKTTNKQQQNNQFLLVMDFRSAPLLKKAFLSIDEDQKGSFCKWRWLSSKFVKDVNKDEFHNDPQCGFWVEHYRTCFHFPKQRDTAVTWLKNCRYGVKLLQFI